MANPKKMTVEAVRLISKISTWCLKNNNQHFTCFFDYSGHVGTAEVKVYVNGWSSTDDESYDFEFRLAGRFYDEDELHGRVHECLSELRGLKKISNKKHQIK